MLIGPGTGQSGPCPYCGGLTKEPTFTRLIHQVDDSLPEVDEEEILASQKRRRSRRFHLDAGTRQMLRILLSFAFTGLLILVVMKFIRSNHYKKIKKGNTSLPPLELQVPEK